MSEYEEIKKAAGDDEDWAVLPFDEAEDDERWAKLDLELDELAENVASHEAVFGEILMKQDLSEVKSEDEYEETDDPF
ncbi:MAG: hypothetical protein ACR2MD_17605 [Aridibacter sp.]